MKKLLFIFTLVLSSKILFAGDMINPDKLSPALQKQIQSELIDQQATKDQKITVTTAEEWSNIAKGLGEAVKQLCQSLNVELNNFIQTPAGKLIIYVLLWQLVGATLVKIGLSLLVMIIILLSFRYFHFRKFKKQKDGSVLETSFEWHSYDAKCWSAAFHAISFFVIFVVLICII